MKLSDQENKGTIIRSVQKSLEILKIIMHSDTEVSIQEIQSALDYNISTLHHQLKTLLDAGFVSQNKTTKAYSIGLELFTHAILFNEPALYLNKIDPILQSCSNQIGETVNLFIEKNHEVICIRGVESTKILKANLQIGRRLPKDQTAAGKVFNVFMDSSKRTDDHEYNLGYISEVNEYDEMISAIAVPVYSKDRKLTFSLCSIMPSSRVDISQFDAIASILKSTSAQITEIL
jgi:DNA-binding IclR family transcriptional regulator